MLPAARPIGESGIHLAILVVALGIPAGRSILGPDRGVTNVMIAALAANEVLDNIAFAFMIHGFWFHHPS